LAGLANLERLEIAECPVTDRSPLDRLPKLARVNGLPRRLWMLPRRPAAEAGEGQRLAAPAMEAAAENPGQRRLLILDLDGTLWGGSAVGSLVFGRSGGPEGLAFLKFQQKVKALARRGLLLAVCSLNDPQVARQPFLSRDDMPLALEDFAAFKANWREKAHNILAIGRELGVPLAEMVFADNEPYQRYEVRRRLPEVAVPELPLDPRRYIQALKQGGWFKAYFEADAPEGAVSNLRGREEAKP
jgi:HAD superfamily phosphatase (TIGR01681 family)